jgi:transcriptional regulator with XRE-family HTH domain
MIGDRLRDARQRQQLSLVQVAAKAEISAATLSRIENEKQALDVAMLFALARILHIAPEELIGDGSEHEEELAQTIARMPAVERTRLWRQLASSRRTSASGVRDSGDMSARLEELLAHIDFLRQEIESVKLRMNSRGRESNHHRSLSVE